MSACESPEKEISGTLLFYQTGGVTVKNLDIRQEAKAAGVMLWQIASECGCNDSNFSRRLRRELSSDEKQKIRQIIARLSKEINI